MCTPLQQLSYSPVCQPPQCALLSCESLQDLHQQAYGFVQDLPQSSDPSSPDKALHDQWEKPTLAVTTMLPAYPLNTLETTNTTLWDAGQTIVVGLHKPPAMVVPWLVVVLF